MNGADLLTIMRYHARPGDSPARKSVPQRRIQFDKRKDRIILPNFPSNAIMGEKVNEDGGKWSEIFDGTSTFPTESLPTNIFDDPTYPDGMDCTGVEDIFGLGDRPAEEDPNEFNFL